MSYCEDQPVCPHTCRCGSWDSCPGYPFRAFTMIWQRIANAHVAAQDIYPTRWQRFKALFRSPLPIVRLLK